jgi:hypothetical protein
MREQHQAHTLGFPHVLDRRSGARLIPPPCPECGNQDRYGQYGHGPQPVMVVSRTDYIVYLRCAACGHVWSTPKPNMRPLGD